MYNDLVSVIVPIYNVEKYLEGCINSIIGQTYKNLEIILVNDGSTDNCLNICNKWKNKDNRIIVVDKENGGLSDARNVGINLAKGKYLIFVDSDDYLDVNFIKVLLDAIKLNNTEIVECGLKKVLDSGEVINEIKYENNCIKTSNEMIKDLNNGHRIDNIVVWNKMYLSKLFKDIRFPVGKINEDEFTTYKVLYNAKNVCIVNQCLYYYRYNPNSIMGRKYNLKRLDCIQAYEERIKFFLDKKEDELVIYTTDLFLIELRTMYLNLKKYYPNEKYKINNIIQKYRISLKNVKNSKLIPFNKKLKHLIFYLFPNIIYFIKVIILKKL